MNKSRVLIGWPDGGHVGGGFMKSMLALQRWEMENPTPDYELLLPERASSLYVQENRNNLVHIARDRKADWLLQLDSDNIFKPDLLRIIMRTAHPETRPIVIGLYANVSSLETGEFVVVDHIFGETENGDYQPVVPPENLQPFQVDAAGTGIFLTHLSIYEQIEEPWYWLYMIQVLGREKPQIINEDLAFCRKAREVGYPIWCDPLAEVVHMKTIPLVASTMRGFLARSVEVEQQMNAERR